MVRRFWIQTEIDQFMVRGLKEYCRSSQISPNIPRYPETDLPFYYWAEVAFYISKEWVGNWIVVLEVLVFAKTCQVFNYTVRSKPFFVRTLTL